MLSHFMAEEKIRLRAAPAVCESRAPAVLPRKRSFRTPGDRRFSVECGDLLRRLMLHDETTTIAQRAAELEESPALASYPETLSAAYCGRTV